MQNKFEKYENDFREYLAYQEQLSAVVKEKFLSCDLSETKRVSSKSYLVIVLKTYQILCLFPDEKVSEKLRSIGFNDSHLRWFIPVKEILKEFDRIDAALKIKIARLHAMELIRDHLDTKISIEFMDWAGFVGTYNNKPGVSSFAIELRKLLRRRNYADGILKTFKNEFEFYFNGMIESIEKLSSDGIDTIEFLIEMADGKTKSKYLNLLLTSCIWRPDNVSENKFLSTVYDLFRLIMKDEYSLLSEEEFNVSRKGIYKNNYDLYKALRIKKLILNK